MPRGIADEGAKHGRSIMVHGSYIHPSASLAYAVLEKYREVSYDGWTSCCKLAVAAVRLCLLLVDFLLSLCPMLPMLL